METSKQNFSQYLTALRILHLALALGLIVFGSVVHFVIAPEFAPKNVGDSALFVNIAAGLLIVNTALAYWLFKQRLTEARKLAALGDKLATYRFASILKFALVEGSCLVSITFYLIFGNIVLMGIGALGILILALNHPSATRLKMDLDLSPAEIARLDDPNETIAEIPLFKRY